LGGWALASPPSSSATGASGQTYSETGCRWKGHSSGVFSICWTGGGRWEEAGGSLQLPLRQTWLLGPPPHWEPPPPPPPPRGCCCCCLGTLPGVAEEVVVVERGVPWLWFSPPPPGLGVFWMALGFEEKKKLVYTGCGLNRYILPTSKYNE